MSDGIGWDGIDDVAVLTPESEPPPDPGIVETGPWVGIANEFTGVLVRQVRTRNGSRLQMWVPSRGYSILLDAMQLEIIAAQDPAAFTTLFARKLGSA